LARRTATPEDGKGRRVSCAAFRDTTEDYSAGNTYVDIYFNEHVVQELLSFQRIEVTHDIIRAAAGNITCGEKILQLLLKREYEDGTTLTLR
jgi:hypothetical protein